MIDVHCHLGDNKFLPDVDDVISKARQAGVKKIVVVAEFPNQFERILQLHEKYPDLIVAGIGAHPQQKRNRSVELKHWTAVEEFYKKYSNRIGCVGEVGLDFSNTSRLPEFLEGAKKSQIEVFRKQIQLAKERSLALNVHSRNASVETINTLIAESASRVVLHAFDGSKKEVQRAIQAGFMISIPPAFTTSQQGRMLVETVPLSLLLLETDSPALGPVKGERNEPANSRISANFIADVKSIAIEDVITATSKNACALFGFELA